MRETGAAAIGEVRQLTWHVSAHLLRHLCPRQSSGAPLVVERGVQRLCIPPENLSGRQGRQLKRNGVRAPELPERG